jgi:hypothetical protein
MRHGSGGAAGAGRHEYEVVLADCFPVTPPSPDDPPEYAYFETYAWTGRAASDGDALEAAKAAWQAEHGDPQGTIQATIRRC